MVSWTRSHLIDTRYTAMRRNLVPGNPSFELTNTATYTNLATNPSFETTAGTTSTLRTNLLTTPNLSVGIGTWDATSTTHVAVAGGRQFTSTGAGSRTVYQPVLALTTAAPMAVKVRVGIPAGQPGLTFQLTVRHGPSAVSGTAVAVAAGTDTTLTLVGTSPVAGPPGSEMRVEVVAQSTAVGNQWVIYDNATVEQVALDRPMFSGSSASPDSDMTVAWTGTANASTSIVRGTDVAAVPSGGIRSTMWARHGAASVRRLGGTTSNDSYAVVASTPVGGGYGVILEPGKTYTVLAWLRQDQALTGTPSANGSRQIVYTGLGGNTPVVKSTQQANAAGVYEHRITFTVNTTEYAQVRLYNGTSWGNGDVWWDDLVIVEGTYTGGYFDGATSDEPGLVTAWTGTANASTSTAFNPAAMTSVWLNLVQNPAGVSTGTPWTASGGVATYSQGPALGPFATSARWTRVGTGTSAFAIATPHVASTAYRLRIRFRASEALNGSSAYFRPALSSVDQALIGTFSIPAGESEIVLSGTSGPAAVTATGNIALIVASGQGTIGATLDVAMSLVQGVSEPGYLFNGSSPAIVDPPMAFSWVGAPNASTSRASGMVPVSAGVGPFAVRSAMFRSAGWSDNGSYSLLVTPTSGTNSSYVYWGGTVTMALGLTAGRTYVLAVTRYLQAPLTGSLSALAGQVSVQMSRGGGTYDPALTVSSGTMVNVAGATRLSMILTIPADVVGVAVLFNHGGIVGSGDIRWDSLLIDHVTGLAPGAVLTSYFDGDFDWAAWRGAPGMSTSIGYRWALP